MEKNAAVAGAVPLAFTIAASPFAVAICVPPVVLRYVPAALYQLMLMSTAPSAAGVYTCAAAETVSPGRTGCPEVPPGLPAYHCPAPPAAVLSSECEPSVGHTVGEPGSNPEPGICRTGPVVPMSVP